MKPLYRSLLNCRCGEFLQFPTLVAIPQCNLGLASFREPSSSSSSIPGAVPKSRHVSLLESNDLLSFNLGRRTIDDPTGINISNRSQSNGHSLPRGPRAPSLLLARAGLGSRAFGSGLGPETRALQLWAFRALGFFGLRAFPGFFRLFIAFLVL